jgi:hypothetical protein
VITQFYLVSWIQIYESYCKPQIFLATFEPPVPRTPGTLIWWYTKTIIVWRDNSFPPSGEITNIHFFTSAHQSSRAHLSVVSARSYVDGYWCSTVDVGTGLHDGQQCLPERELRVWICGCWSINYCSRNKLRHGIYRAEINIVSNFEELNIIHCLN